MVERHRLAPVSDGALRIVFCCILKCLLSLLILKGMEQGNSAYYQRLRRGRAASRKDDFAKSFFLRRSTRGANQGNDPRKANKTHRFSGGDNPILRRGDP